MVVGAVRTRPQLLGHRQAYAGRDLLRAQKVFVRCVLQILALERDDALIAGGIRPLVDGHGEVPATEQRSRIGRARGDGVGDARSVEAGAGAHLAGRGVVDDQHADRPVALGLQDEAAVEFQRRAEQHREHDRLAQQLRYRCGIVVPREDGVDRRTEAHDPPAQVERLDLKGQDGVVFRGRSRRTGRDVGLGVRHDRRNIVPVSRNLTPPPTIFVEAGIRADRWSMSRKKPAPDLILHSTTETVLFVLSTKR